MKLTYNAVRPCPLGGHCAQYKSQKCQHGEKNSEKGNLMDDNTLILELQRLNDFSTVFQEVIMCQLPSAIVD